MTQYTLSDLRNLTQELSILYVEDEAMLREGMVGSLRQLFKGVEVAEDGAIGLALYQNSHYDLVITDISMPNMDGITMIRQIKSVNPEARIIVTSAQNDADKLLELINLGVDRFLTKPIDKTMLIETLFSVCNAIISIKQARAYQEQLEQKVRLLETNLTKEYIKTKAAASTSEENREYDNSYEDYFQHLLREEIDELCELNEELDYDILLAFQNDRIDPAYVSRVSQRYNRYGAILSRHSAFSHIGLGLQTMCREFDAHQQLFIDRIASIRALLESFNFTLITFRKKILQISSSNPTFYNASLLSDISMIVNLLNQTEIDSDIEFF